MIDRISNYRKQFEKVFLAQYGTFLSPVRQSTLGSEQISYYEPVFSNCEIRIKDVTSNNARSLNRNQVDSLLQIQVRVKSYYAIKESMVLRLKNGDYSIKSVFPEEASQGIFTVLICELLNSKVKIK